MKRRLAKLCNETSHKLSKKSEQGLVTFSGKLHDCPASVLSLDRVLPAGQAFRWKKISSNNGSLWRGVIGKLVFDLSQDGSAINVLARRSLMKDANFLEIDPIQILKNYFNLHIDYRTLINEWAAKDVNFDNVTLDTNGARVLAVDPTEALFSFICSSNNNIPRISKMVNKLAQFYGEKITNIDDIDYYTFPKASDLIGEDVEKKLREAGFGYRASFIVKTARKLNELGGEKWLLELKDPNVSYSVTIAKLLEFPGVGRKVADCVSLIGLGKFEAVPIDTHVFQVASKLYKIPCLGTNKTGKVSPRTYQDIADFFRSLWGPHAGWAQQILFTQRVLDRHGTLT